MTKEIILDYLHQHKEEFNKRFGVTKIALFGSYARNEATPTSDIDIAIEVTQPSLKNRFALQSILENAFNLPIDLGYLKTFRKSIRREIDKDIIYV